MVVRAAVLAVSCVLTDAEGETTASLTLGVAVAVLSAFTFKIFAAADLVFCGKMGIGGVLTGWFMAADFFCAVTPDLAEMVLLCIV